MANVRLFPQKYFNINDNLFYKLYTIDFSNVLSYQLHRKNLYWFILTKSKKYINFKSANVF